MNRPKAFGLAVSWSPDGKTLATAVSEQQGPAVRSGVALLSVQNERQVSLAVRWTSVVSVSWVPNGNGLVVAAAEGVRSPTLWFVSYPEGTTRRLFGDLGGYRDVSVSADGKTLVALRQELRSSLWMTSATKPEAATQLTSRGAQDDGRLGVSWTGDGRILFTARSIDGQDFGCLIHEPKTQVP
jgi:Tol biopolymer transport system component